MTEKISQSEAIAQLLEAFKVEKQYVQVTVLNCSRFGCEHNQYGHCRVPERVEVCCCNLSDPCEEYCELEEKVSTDTKLLAEEAKLAVEDKNEAQRFLIKLVEAALTHLTELTKVIGEDVVEPNIDKEKAYLLITALAKAAKIELPADLPF